LELATTGLFRAKWTNQIHEEWIGGILNSEPRRDRAKLERTRDLMNKAVLDCLVQGYEELIPALTLPDENDRHVLAAAIACGADAIITNNLKDFPEQALAHYNIEPQHPDEFIHHQIGLNNAAVIVAAQRCRARLKNPAVTAQDYLDTLRKQSLPLTVDFLSHYISVI
jgi:hypothetical protein